MLQRLQSIFMFLVSVAGFLSLIFPFVVSDNDVSVEELKDGSYTAADNYILYGILTLVTFLAFLNIFLFKIRKVQLLINKLSIVFMLALLVVLAFPFFPFMKENVNVKPQLTLAFPLVMIILLFVANKFIKKDEKLVKSMDSLR